MTTATTRTERAATPLARDAIRKIAESYGGCLRPVQLRRTDTRTGEVAQVMVPCGATLASVCPSCAERAKALRAVQCRAPPGRRRAAPPQGRQADHRPRVRSPGRQALPALDVPYPDL